MQENVINFYSHVMGRSIDLLVTGHWGYPILMFPTSMGNAFQNRDSGLLEAIRPWIDGGRVKTYNIDSIDFQSFYAKDLSPAQKIHNYNLYSRFLIEELVPQIQKESNVHRIGTAGCSFGAYHAANFAFRNPGVTDFLIAMSGAFDIKSFMKGYYDDNVYFNNPVDYLVNAESWKYNHLRIVLGTSDWDICREDNIRMSRLLGEKQINHWYDEKKWAPHDWPLWNNMFPEYLLAYLN